MMLLFTDKQTLKTPKQTNTFVKTLSALLNISEDVARNNDLLEKWIKMLVSLDESFQEERISKHKDINVRPVSHIVREIFDMIRLWKVPNFYSHAESEK